MAVYLASKGRGTLDGRKYYYSFQYNSKKYTSIMYKTKDEAENAEYYKRQLLYEEKQLIEKNEHEKKNKINNITFKGIYDELVEYKIDKVKQTTLYSYTQRIPHLKLLYDVKVKDFNTTHYLTWRSYMVKLKLNNSTKNGIQKLLKELLNYAYKWHDIDVKCTYVKMESFNNPDALPNKMNFFTIDEFKQFISVIDDIKYKCIFELLFYCGLRRGELLGLTWKNINFTQKRISIINNVIMPHNGIDYWVVTSPKNRTSIRTIPIPSTLVEHLTEYKNLLKQKYNDFSAIWFISQNAKPLAARTLDYRKDLYIKKSGVKHIRIHDFRHSCASLLINNGANVLIVAKYLGHAKLEETLNTYSHLYDEKLIEITNLINKLDI